MNPESEIYNLTLNSIAEIGSSAELVIPLLQSVQDKYGYLPEDALMCICDNTEITRSQIYSVATFYSQFRLKPAGKHSIKVCVGTACHVKGATLIYDAFKRVLNISEEEDTDKNGTFTVEKVACLGCCTIAPAVQIDDMTYGHLTVEKASGTIDDFLRHIEEGAKKDSKEKFPNGNINGEILIGLGSCCVASGSADIKRELDESLRKYDLQIPVKRVGCVGVCNQVPMIEIIRPGKSSVLYTKISKEDVRSIVLKNFRPKGLRSRISFNSRRIIDKLTYKDIPDEISRFPSDISGTPVSDFLKGQVNIATEYRGVLEPLNFDEYARLNGILALEKSIKEYSSEEIISIILESGLKGRGGAGFPTGEKWKKVANSISDEKIVICNGDEGDPGAFMDRMLLESYPFRVMEGMIIAAIAVGARKGYFYVRAEYKLAVRQIKEAIRIAHEKNILGDNILGSSFSFDIELFEGAGAFVCGEETALISSIEGKRGFPVLRPPYPAESGLWRKPTLINNAETFALVPWILRSGAGAFNRIGTDQSKGTKVFALAGKINRGGLIEVPMGTSIDRIVNEIGGGIEGGKQFKAVQIGGPSGGCVPSGHSDLSVDYESLIENGAMMGSGGLIVLDESDCMVDVAKYFLSFTQDQSCGKCTFCRIGTKKMLDILTRITNGKGNISDLDELEELANKVRQGSLCGLGKTAPNPVLSTLKHYRNEYLAHISGECPSGKCTSLIKYKVKDSCIGCTKCSQSCPVDAIPFTPHRIHIINTDTCIKCDVCRQVCPNESILIERY